MRNDIVTPMEIQIDQNRINLIDQELFRLEREVAEQPIISDDLMLLAHGFVITSTM